MTSANLVDSEVVLLPPSNAPLVHEYELSPSDVAAVLSLEGAIIGGEGDDDPKAGLLLLNCYDSGGKDVRLASLPFSEKLRGEYFYLLAGGGNKPFEKRVSIPAGVRTVLISLMRFHGNNALRLTGFGCLLNDQPLQCSNYSNTKQAADEFRQLVKSVVFGPQPKVSVKEIKEGKAYGEDIRLPLDWTCSHFNFNKRGYNVNGFVFLDETVREFESTGESSLLRLLESYVEDFVDKNKVAQKSLWAWYDDAIARRVQRMSYYLRYFGDRMTAAVKDKMRESLVMQAEVLMDDSYYRFKHNHGMFQDLGLIVYSLLVCDNEKDRERYLDKACARFVDYIKYVYTPDGVHKEHSPGYACEVQNVVRVVAKMLENVRPDVVDQLQKYVAVADLHLSALTKPDGTLPGIGDSRILKHAVKAPGDVVLKEGGYAVFRSSPDDPPDMATWMLFMAATHNSVHKHSDDLSFLLYHKGDLFVEAGMKDYDYHAEQTAYAYSGYAHNVLCIDDKDFPVKVSSNGFRAVLPEALRTRIVDYSIDTPVRYVTGVQERFAGVRQERTLRYDSEGCTVDIEDVLIGDHNFSGTLLFHLAPDVSLRTGSDSNSFVLSRSSPVAELAFSSECPMTVRVVVDGEYPPYRTWLFEGPTIVKRGIVILAQVVCHSGENHVKTHIVLR